MFPLNIVLIALIIAGTGIVALVFFFMMRTRSCNHRVQPPDARTLQIILDNIPLALFAKDVSKEYAYLGINKTAEQTFCLKAADMIGKNDYDFFPEAQANFFRNTDKQVMAGNRMVDIDAEYVTTPKGTITAHTIKVPIYDAAGAPIILLGLLEDITEKYKSTERLLQAKTRAEQADKAKSEFLANMSHELRTPLNSILGMTRLLQETNVDDKQRMLAQIIFSSSSMLLEIVNDILDLSKIESGTLQLEEIGFDLAAVHSSLVEGLNPLALDKKLPALALEDSGAPYVCGDPLRLTRILTNLVSNAIKYSETGQITIKTSHSFANANNVYYRCEVTDKGIGIPPAQYDRIFDKFVQGDTSTTRRYGGTGLGLAITKQLVELMGGGIGLSSEVGKGSTFWVEIPFAVTNHIHNERAGHRQAALYSTLPPSQIRVLLAEDNRVNQVFMEKLMEKFGIVNYFIVENGELAVEQYSTHGWDLILMDCHMPVMNGYDATAAIRALERVNGGHIPIIAMTANAMVGDREKCLRCGMDDYLSKPIIFEEMSRLLSQWVDLGNADKKA